MNIHPTEDTDQDPIACENPGCDSPDCAGCEFVSREDVRDEYQERREQALEDAA